MRQKTKADEPPRGDAGLREEAGPLYQMVLAALKAEILRGVYPVGSAIPAENALITRFGVSRHTVREAVRHLRDLGLVEPKQGLGTIVLRPGGPQVYVHQVDSISNLHDYNVDSRYDDNVQAVTLNADLAALIGAKVGESWLKIDGTRFDATSGEPICAAEIYVAQAYAGVTRLLGRRSGPIFALIEAVYGESIDEVDQRVRAVPAMPSVAQTLKIKPGDTVVELRRHYRLLGGRTAEITLNYYRSDLFNLSMTLRRVRR